MENIVFIDLASAESVKKLASIHEGDVVRVGKNGSFGDRLICHKDPKTGKLVLGAAVKFDRIRRVTGYLVGTLDRFNDAKRAEVKDRVVHMHMPGLPRKPAPVPANDEPDPKPAARLAGAR